MKSKNPPLMRSNPSLSIDVKSYDFFSFQVFPRAHTCFNRIDMPMYKTKAELQKFLTLAVSMEATGFDIE